MMLQTIQRYVAAFIAILAAVKELVKLVEIPKHGEEKKDAVLEGIQILVDLAGGLLSWLPREAIVRTAEAAIELWVRFNNLTDAWNKPTEEEVVKN